MEFSSYLFYYCGITNLQRTKGDKMISKFYLKGNGNLQKVLETDTFYALVFDLDDKIKINNVDYTVNKTEKDPEGNLSVFLTLDCKTDCLLDTFISKERLEKEKENV